LLRVHRPDFPQTLFLPIEIHRRFCRCICPLNHFFRHCRTFPTSCCCLRHVRMRTGRAKDRACKVQALRQAKAVNMNKLINNLSTCRNIEDTCVLQVAGTFNFSKKLNMLNSFDLSPKTGDLSPLLSTCRTATGDMRKVDRSTCRILQVAFDM